MTRPAFLIRCLLVALFITAAIPAEAGKLSTWLQQRAGTSDHLTCAKLSGMMKSFKNTAGQKADGKPAPSMTVSYGNSRAQKIDIYLPEKAVDPAPIIIMVHGGAWCIGDKDMEKVTVNKLARWRPRGFIFVSINYRMLPDHADPMMQAEDIAAAVAYVQKNAFQFNGNPSKIILMGHSAGAHLVSLLGADAKLAAKYGVKPWLGTVSLDSAALYVPDIMKAKHAGFYDDAFGSDPAYWQEASPRAQLSKQSLPWLGVCSAFRAVSCIQTDGFIAEAVKRGNRAEKLEQNLSHAEINADLGLAGKYTEAVEQFMGSLDPAIAARLAR